MSMAARLLIAQCDGTLSIDVAPPAVALLARRDRRDEAASFFGPASRLARIAIRCKRLQLSALGWRRCKYSRQATRHDQA